MAWRGSARPDRHLCRKYVPDVRLSPDARRARPQLPFGSQLLRADSIPAGCTGRGLVAAPPARAGSDGTDTISIICTQTNPTWALNVSASSGSAVIVCSSDPLNPVCTDQYGGGNVTSSPGTIACGATPDDSGTQPPGAGVCTNAFANGTVVTLTAVTSGNFTDVFQGWTGCDTVSGLTCTVTMNAIKNVAAHWQLVQ